MDIFRFPTTLYYPNGQMKYRSRHIDRIIVIEEWWQNGEMLRTCFRDIETLAFVGTRKEYDSGGNLVIEIPYNIDGRLHGTQREYSSDGHVIHEIVYDNDKVISER